MGFLSLVGVISEVAPSAGGLVAPRPPAGVLVITPGGPGQPTRSGPAGPGHAPVHPVVYDRDVPRFSVAYPCHAAVRRRDPL